MDDVVEKMAAQPRFGVPTRVMRYKRSWAASRGTTGTSSPFAAAPGIDALIASRFRHTPLAFVPYRPQGRTTPLPRPLTSASPVQRLVAGPNLGPPPGLHDDFTAAPDLLGGGDQCGDIHRSRDARWRSLPA